MISFSHLSYVIAFIIRSNFGKRTLADIASPAGGFLAILLCRGSSPSMHKYSLGHSHTFIIFILVQVCIPLFSALDSALLKRRQKINYIQDIVLLRNPTSRISPETHTYIINLSEKPVSTAGARQQADPTEIPGRCSLPSGVPSQRLLSII